MPKAKEYALRAITLNPDLSEAHTSLGIVLQEFEYDFHRAEAEYKRAIELNPNNSLAHQMYGALLSQLGRFADGDRHFRRALSLDPLSPMGSWIYPFALFLAKRYEESTDHARKLLELDSNFAAAYLILSFSNQMRGENERCVENYCRFLDMVGMTSASNAAKSGFESGGWQGFLEAMTSTGVRKAVTSYISAVYFAAAGDTDSALECLEESFAKREGHMVMLNVDPRFDDIRAEDGFQRLLSVVGFPK